MSRRSRNGEADKAASSAGDRARQAAARVKPLASSTGAAARRRAHKTRAWVARMVERTGQALQDNVAAKVSAMWSSAAQRLEPAKPPSRRWRKLAGISMITAAAGAVAAVVRNRRKPDLTTSADADGDDVTPAAEMRDGQGTTSTAADTHVNRPFRTS